MSAVRKLSLTKSHWNRCLTSLILSVCLLSICLGCQKKPPIDGETEQAPAEGEDQSASTPDEKAAKEKPIDPKLVVKSGEPMTLERYKAVMPNLKQLGLSFHNLHEANKYFLPSPKEHPEYYDANGRLKVSWRVHLLPFLDQKELYGQFKLNEAWDSPHNAPLAKNMPDIFRSPDSPADSTKTRFRVFECEREKGRNQLSSMFPLGTPSRIRDTLDGTSNTILVVEVGPDQAVEWTKPGGLSVAQPQEELGATGTTVAVLRADGSIALIKRDLDDRLWKGIVGPQDRIAFDWDRIKANP
ncbi:DUF1559 family PulG-like putative transporter [Gimesia panareensis]|uniref:DUF1559 family PulG-like putative transporter n=1 Tax=Gimesia panareensis TaxID=2527978 RepID=UPI00118A9CA4|nr:DUF1559 domain-containing protein [Gimesia panareensis]QDU50789.1 hypothetical protein Pan110_31490 [Gimesia panareensis]